MFLRCLRIVSALALICICSNAMAVTGSTTFTIGYGLGAGFSIDECGGDNFGSVATPTLSDGKKICSLWELDLYPINDNLLHLVIEGFTSDPGSNYFNTLTVSCGMSFPSTGGGEGGYYYNNGQASWTIDLVSLGCIGLDQAGYTESLTIQ